MLKTFQSLVEDPLLYKEVFSIKVKHNYKNLEANEVVITQGQNNNNLYYIVSGSVRVVAHKKFHSVNKAIKTSNILAILGKSEIFGLFSLFDESPAGADLVTNETSVILEIDKTSFLNFLNSEPEFGYKILYDFIVWLVKRLRLSNNMLVDVASQAVEMQKAIHQKNHLKSA